jgi:hypothetical protein
LFCFQLTTTSRIPEICTDIVVYAPPLTKELPDDNFDEESTNDIPDDDVDSMRRELVDAKKQVLLIMSQHKKSVEKLREAQAQKDAAAAEAVAVSSRETYMLELMKESSLDMAGVYLVLSYAGIFAVVSLIPYFLLLRLLYRPCYGGPTGRGKSDAVVGTCTTARLEFLGFTRPDSTDCPVPGPCDPSS